MALLLAVLVPVLVQAGVIIVSHGAPHAATWPGADVLGPWAYLAPQAGATLLGLLILGQKFQAWAVALAALYIPGMLSLLQWLLVPMVGWLGYAPPAL